MIVELNNRETRQIIINTLAKEVKREFPLSYYINSSLYRVKRTYSPHSDRYLYWPEKRIKRKIPLFTLYKWVSYDKKIPREDWYWDLSYPWQSSYETLHDAYTFIQCVECNMELLKRVWIVFSRKDKIL